MAYVEYEFFGERFASAPVNYDKNMFDDQDDDAKSPTRSPNLDYECVHHVDCVTQEFIDWVSSDDDANSYRNSNRNPNRHAGPNPDPHRHAHPSISLNFTLTLTFCVALSLTLPTSSWRRATARATCRSLCMFRPLCRCLRAAAQPQARRWRQRSARSP
mmetsp:Transcript_45138/g.123832  ORF Transcript_45138/g.123832 Transcript_45138/m.123832 type:complete len:159 (+) Transcript_45138:387-863(+)